MTFFFFTKIKGRIIIMKKSNYVIRNTLGMFDFLKGSVMLIVMLYHIAGLFDFMQGYDSYDSLFSTINPLLLIVYVFIYALGEAAMPIMFILSGYGFRKTTFKKCFKTQCKTLLIPYVVSMILVAVVNFVAFYINSGNFRGTLAGTFTLFKNMLFGYASSSPNWFLLALIIGNLIFNQLLNMLEGKKLLAAVVGVACIGWLLSLGKELPLSVSQALIATMYIGAGYFAKKRKVFVTQYSVSKRRLIIIGAILYTVAFKALGDDLNMAFCVYTYGPITLVGNLIISMGFIYMFLLLNRYNAFLISQIRRIGRYSLYVLCIHTIEFKAVGQFLQGKFVQNWTGGVVSRNLIQFGVRCIVVLGLTYIFVQLKHVLANKSIKFHNLNYIWRKQA